MRDAPDKRQGFIESFDGDFAVIFQADRSIIRIRRSALPPEAKEGFFVIEADRPDHYVIDYSITEKRQQELRRMSESYNE